MRTIRCEFIRLDDIRITKLLDAVGVYVIWDGQAQARPTYIGEGDIWSRLSEHRDRFVRPFSGYAALLGERTTSTKRDSQIVEAALLEVAGQTDRFPPQNAKGGNGQGISRLFDHHGVLKITISGWDPFAPPEKGRKMQPGKLIEYRLEGDDITIYHEWRVRRTLRM